MDAKPSAPIPQASTCNSQTLDREETSALLAGKMKGAADQGVHVPTGMKEYGPAEDAHMILDHLVGAYLMRIVVAAAAEQQAVAA